eukprot:CAMPEP_0197242892 /NCGR_PEP_ID=MMETSP1429-20130617/8503_1 /TAXON_ID=49237 /ORGANISM="Chaetoceros  sp., Strain UNC1202" /LENGTH=333 /DNA_ID=CAMNT_0042703005 /DNA_START=12 /DNA_END=1013 /DNA_ORIENTATION=+
MTFIKIQNKVEELGALNKSKGAKPAAKDAKFMELLGLYDDAVTIAHTRLEAYEGMADGPAVNKKRLEWSNLWGYCKFEKLKLQMERNEKMAKVLRDGDKEMTSIMKRSKGRVSAVQQDADARYKIVEEIAHLYDALLQDARAVAALPGGGDGNEDIEDEFYLEANANVLRIRALRCYYIARMYASDTVAKYPEALSLFGQASKLASEAAEEVAACQNMVSTDEIIESMVELEEEITVAQCRSKASAYLAKRGSGASTVTSGMNLLRRLEDFDSGGKVYRLGDVPPALEPVPCKPFFFDVANNYVRNFPGEALAVHVHLKRKKNRGLFSWFGRS